MKKWVVLLGLLIGYMQAFGASNDWSFLATLSSPIASFREVETKDCAVTTPKGEFNFGSAKSTGGTIQIEGAAPMVVGTDDNSSDDGLFMEDSTGLTGFNGRRWLVDALTVGGYGSVTVDALVADTFSVASSATMDVSNKMQLDADGYIAKGEAAQDLNVGNGKFHFVYSSGDIPSNAEKTASWESQIIVAK